MFKKIDQILRLDSQSAGEDKGNDFSTASLLQIIFLLGIIYGAFMGLYSLIRDVNANGTQVAVSAIKVPFLFLLTLIVTVPSLYVFSTLAGSGLAIRRHLVLVLSGTAITMAVLASLGPITAFFTLCTDSYDFMVILNVIFFAISGAIGLKFITKALSALNSVPAEAAVESKPENKVPELSAPENESSATKSLSTNSPVKTADAPSKSPTAQPVRLSHPKKTANPTSSVLKIWALMYMCVGAQMSWIMRPFVGDPKSPFVLFRGIDSNFFEAIGNVLAGLFR